MQQHAAELLGLLEAPLECVPHAVSLVQATIPHPHPQATIPHPHIQQVYLELDSR